MGKPCTRCDGCGANYYVENDGMWACGYCSSSIRPSLPRRSLNRILGKGPSSYPWIDSFFGEGTVPGIGDDKNIHENLYKHTL